MQDLTALGLRPFVPARDYAASMAFYEAIGFRTVFATPEVALLQQGAAAFLLQAFYVKDFAENLMLQLLVPNVDAWWDELDRADLVARFGIRRPVPPAMQPWGAKVGFLHDPCGVLWHVSQH